MLSALCLDFAKKIREFKCTKPKDITEPESQINVKKIQPHILMYLVISILYLCNQLSGEYGYIIKMGMYPT